MSKVTQSYFGFARKINPDGKRQEPAVWFQEVRLLRKLSLETHDVIRRIKLKTGLNILWSPPEDRKSDSQWAPKILELLRSNQE